MSSDESEEEACETMVSQKGKIILLHNGFPMYKNKNVDKVSYWECRLRLHKKNGSGEFAKCIKQMKEMEII